MTTSTLTSFSVLQAVKYLKNIVVPPQYWIKVNMPLNKETKPNQTKLYLIVSQVIFGL